jgi:hypothetical protein
MEAAITRDMLRENELLEEPGGMSQVPLGRACVRHGLELVILDDQRRAKPLRLAPDGTKAVHESRPVGKGFDGQT